MISEMVYNIFRMKKILACLLATVVLSGSCLAIMPVIIRDRDNGKTIHVGTGDYIDIALNGNPTTGYDWNVESKLTPVLNKISGPSFKRWSERIGAGGKVTYRFRAIKNGTVLLKLVYKRSWEKVAPVKTFVIKIMVD